PTLCYLCPYSQASAVSRAKAQKMAVTGSGVLAAGASIGMPLRLVGYLAFLWANTALGWIFIDEGRSGGGGGGAGAAVDGDGAGASSSPPPPPPPAVSRASHAWWLVLLSALTTLSLVTLTTSDPGKIEEEGQESLAEAAAAAAAATAAGGVGVGGSGGGAGAGDDQLCPASASASEAAGGSLAQQQYFTQACSLCNNNKPARAHHCRICNRCVRRMDHHCRWVGRCVGAGNYKAYLLTLLYACVSSGAMLVILWRRWRRVSDDDPHPDAAAGVASSSSAGAMGWMETMGVIVDGFVLVFVFCSVSYLLIWHSYLVAGNVTTIEYFKWKRSMRDLGQYALSPGASTRLSEYDLGILANLREALGHRVWLWLWPGLGDGCHRRRFFAGCGGGSSAVRGGQEEEGSGGESRAGGWWQGAADARNLLHFGRRGSVGRHDEDEDDGERGGRGSPASECSPVAAEEGDNLNSSPEAPPAHRQHHRHYRNGYGQGGDEGDGREARGRQAEEAEAPVAGLGSGLEMTGVRPMFAGRGRPEPV
ncbi:unnamed protein product, partial [Scytosiphon promiscuus]